MDSSKKKETTEGNWIKCQSKSHSGKSYLLNIGTGETKWCNEQKSPTEIDGIRAILDQNSPPAIELRSPANDRLKRLQGNFKLNEKAKPVQQRKKESLENNNKQNEVNKNKQIHQDSSKDSEKPTTSAAAAKSAKAIKLISPKRQPLKRKATSSEIEAQTSSQQIVTNKTVSNAKNVKPNGVVTTISQGIVGTMKGMLKSSWKIATKALEGSSSKSKSSTTSNVQTQALVAQGERGNRKRKLTLSSDKSYSAPPSDEANAPSSTKQAAAPSSLITPLVTPLGSSKGKLIEKGKANARLQDLRNTLQKEVAASTNTDSSEPMEVDFSIPMEVDCDVPTSEASNSLQVLFDNRKNFCNISSQVDTDDVFDTINGNLLRYTSGQQSLNKELRDDHFYFVVDTNILLRNLMFVDDLSVMRFCGTKGTIIYLPYAVIQELDKLKHNYKDESTKAKAVCAIRYVNKKLEFKTRHFQSQTATEAFQHLIDVSSPDDSIINCCLQLKQRIQHIVLLTDDINLRNKAMVNDISVSTKSHLMAKQFKI